MITFTLKEVATAVKAVQVQNLEEEKRINGVTIDSRTVTRDNLFVPIIGERVNGHSFVKDCIAAGACCSLWKADEPNPPEDVPLIFVRDPLVALQRLAMMYRKTLRTTFIGVTGSSGKTSTKDIIASVCSVKYRTEKTQGNKNNEIGVPLTVLGLDAKTQVAVVEMGISDFKEMDLLTAIVQPHIAVITSISESHIDNFHSLEHIVEEKYAITKGLQKNGILFYNVDAPYLDDYAKSHKLEQKMISYGSGVKANVRISSNRLDLDGLRFTCSISKDKEFYRPLLGVHQIHNAVAAMLVGISLSLTTDDIQKGFDSVVLTNNRTQLLRVREALIIDDTYNANPNSMVMSLKMLSDYPLEVKKVAVLGDLFGLGNQAPMLHERIGESYSFKDIDEVWVIGPNSQLMADKIEARKMNVVIRRYEDKDTLKKALTAQTMSLCMILVKASRAMALEEVIPD